MRPTGEWDGASFCHEAFCFADHDELRERLVPFVHEGFERDEPVAVVAGAAARQVLGDALGRDVRRLAAFEPAEGWCSASPDCAREWDHALRELQRAGRPFRVVGEPVWLADRVQRRWSRYEAGANRSWADLCCYCMCVHDRTRLADDVVDDVVSTHPLTWDRQAGAPVANASYRDPAEFVLAAQPSWGRRPADAVARRVADPREARRALVAALPRAWLGREDDIVLAAHELVINALHQAGSAQLCTWTEPDPLRGPDRLQEADPGPDLLVVEVGDSGPGLPDPLRGYVVPGSDPEGGRGLWVAWGLADDVAVRRSAGTCVRLLFRRP